MGIVGTGHRGLGLIRTYLPIKTCQITALCDRYPSELKKAYDIVGNSTVKCYTDHRQMLKEADIDAVLVFPAPEMNAKISCDALYAGKHVMCEVPLCYSVEDCWKLILAVEKTGLKFQLAEQMRFHPSMQAWKLLVRDGRLGQVLFARGEYLHPLPESWYWIDADTGEKIPLEEAPRHPHKKKGRVWSLKHPIWYMPHELSPLLSVLDDQVETVTCLSTSRKNYVHPWFTNPDVEIATMRTKKDTLLSLTAGFTAPNYPKTGYGWHWYQLMGSRGSVETPRSDKDQGKMWLADTFLNQPAEVTWEFDPHKTLADALSSGHDGLDYWPMAGFLRSILDDTVPEMDIYKSVDSAAPAIFAAQSAELGGKPLHVPDFRPNSARKKGVSPRRR